jgi:hypothetical protein
MSNASKPIVMPPVDDDGEDRTPARDAPAGDSVL